jgi:uncharacterized protein YkwD
MKKGAARTFAVGIVVVCVTAMLSASAVAAPGRPAAALTSLEHGVLVDINAFRASHHLAPLRLSSQLTAAALAHTQEMATDGYFGHDSADGSLFWKRIGGFYASTPWRYWSVGENLLWSSPDVDASGALQLWLHSPEHRANLMNPRWREIGVAAVHAAAAGGAFQGLDVTIVTTDFGVRH